MLLFFYILAFGTSNAQYKKPSFEQVIDSILLKRPQTYKEINSYLKYFRKDTAKLKELISIFKKHNYLDGKTYSENLLGIRYRNYSLFDKAIQIHQQALQTAATNNSSKTIRLLR